MVNWFARTSYANAMYFLAVKMFWFFLRLKLLFHGYKSIHRKQGHLFCICVWLEYIRAFVECLTKCLTKTLFLWRYRERILDAKFQLPVHFVMDHKGCNKELVFTHNWSINKTIMLASSWLKPLHRVQDIMESWGKCCLVQVSDPNQEQNRDRNFLIEIWCKIVQIK